MLSRQKSYTLSNKITTIDIVPSPSALAHVQRLLTVKEVTDRQEISEALLAELSRISAVPVVTLRIADRNQYHSKRGGKVVFKQYGVYYPQSQSITIQNRTAVRGQLLAPLTFIDTLLHEWLHHYDFQKLGIESLHTSGFYARLKDLKAKCGIVPKQRA